MGKREKGVINRTSRKIDMMKWGFVVLLFLFGFLANYYYVNYPLSIRIIGWLVLAAIMIMVAAWTSQGHRLWKFFCEARGEMRKVVWPNRQETIRTTIIVIAVVIVFSVIIWVADMFLMWIVNWLTGQV